MYVLQARRNEKILGATNYEKLPATMLYQQK